MATIAEQLTSLANTKTAIKDAIVAKGVSVADTDTFASYATKIGEIQAGGGSATKFGATVDTFLGDVGADGTLQATTWSGPLVFSGVKIIGNSALYQAFYNRSGITSVDMSSLQTIGASGLYQAFNNCRSITSVDLSSLQTVGVYGLGNAFYTCTGITSVDISSLQTVDQNGLQGAFYGCTGITSVNLSSLQSVGSNGLSNTFYNCNKLTTVSFPSLTSVQTNSFGTATYTYIFGNCTALTEIHFRADMQATIEAMIGYADKWGATNATIYFDL